MAQEIPQQPILPSEELVPSDNRVPKENYTEPIFKFTLYENSETMKYVLSLHKIHDFPFLENDLEELKSISNSKKERRVMNIDEIPKFCDATLERVLENVKKINLDVKHGGAEAILHSVNRVLREDKNDRFLAMLTVDFLNSFNLVDKSTLLYEVKLREGLFCVGIRRPPLGVKFLGGAVSKASYFISGLAMRKAANVVDLISLLPELHDPQNELFLLRSCMGVAKLFFVLPMCTRRGVIMSKNVETIENVIEDESHFIMKVVDNDLGALAMWRRISSSRWCREVGRVKKMRLTGSKLMVRGDECLEGCVGADGGEVSRGGDDFWSKQKFAW
ncbi:hypothetical protein Tco_0771395 [Tanacetum coccineum]|uniref:Reverse transcriptase domain-containing protein n=1 Tax=Tanacetum coccineum TaxID=301880 RepID=A0ABQ4ZEY6_9ASTR